MAQFGFFGRAMDNGRRSAWRLIVHVPDPSPERDRELFAWLRDFVIPACLHAPFHTTLELQPPEDDEKS